MKPVKNVSSATLVLAANDAPRAGQLIGDRYRLEQPLERGAMGSVWRAEQVRLRAPVAVKFLDPSLIGDKEMHDRFVQEARSAAAVRSAHVVQVFDYGSDGGLPYIAMELLDGENLDTRLGRGTLTPVELDKIFGEIARGIGKAHSMGVIHRDLKPGNIFIAREGEHEVTKLVDFGIAKVKADALKCTQNVGTHVGTLLGTPQYMSPEQVRGSVTVDHRTDLWALGIIACECLTGRYPFSGTTIGDLTVQICTEKPRAPSSLGEVPPGFDQWFFKATSKKPSKRFESVEVMASALHKLLAQSTASMEGAAWPRRILNLPSQSEMRLACSAVATWPGQAAVKLRAAWLMAAAQLMRLGAEVSRQVAAAALKARALADSDQLTFARPVLSRPGLTMAVMLLVSAVTLVGLTSRTPDSVAASKEPPPAEASSDSAPAPSADIHAGSLTPGAAKAEAEEPSAVVLSALPAGVEAAPPAPTSEELASPSPAPAPRSRPPAQSGATRDGEPSAPAPKPITAALAKAAAKILDTPDPGTRSERAPAKSAPKAQETRSRTTPAPLKRPSQKSGGSGEHPFDDRL